MKFKAKGQKHYVSNKWHRVQSTKTSLINLHVSNMKAELTKLEQMLSRAWLKKKITVRVFDTLLRIWQINKQGWREQAQGNRNL